LILRRYKSLQPGWVKMEQTCLYVLSRVIFMQYVFYD